MNALEIKNLSVSFLMYDRGVKKKALQVISDLNITLRAGEIHAIAGSSGSGKSLLAHAILGILPKNATTNGEMNWFGEPLTPALQKKLRGSRMVLVPQSVNYLDPLMRVGKQICKDRSVALETLKKYELDEKAARKYPFELSGGMARRALVAGVGRDHTGPSAGVNEGSDRSAAHVHAADHPRSGSCSALC